MGTWYSFAITFISPDNCAIDCQSPAPFFSISVR